IMKNIETPLTYGLVILALLLLFIGGMNNTSSDSNKCDGDNLNKEEVSTEETFLNAETIIIENTLDQEGATLDTIIMEPSSEE
ncbi:MAG: hypothetical protein HN564_05410, partial [Flavobacteriales bacterium]|nr:hypothetical protein [Flavobacteriales bacterium]